MKRWRVRWLICSRRGIGQWAIRSASIRSQPITVVLYTREQFSEITRLAGLVSGRFLRAYSNSDQRLARTARRARSRPVPHEFVDALVAHAGRSRNVPAWMNEGLATVLEPAGPADVELTLARTAAWLALSTLHQGFVGLATTDAEIADASSVGAVRRLIDQRGVAALVGLLEDLSRGAPFARAFHRRIAVSFEDFETLVERDETARRKYLVGSWR